MQDGLKKGGANVVFFDGITAGEKDFSTLVARLKKENIDFVYYGGYHPEMGQILRQARAAGLKTQFMGPEGVANVSLSNIAGESAEGLLVTKPKELRPGAGEQTDRGCDQGEETGSERRLRVDHLRGAAVAAGRPESV